jgi:RHS repeat-associated protein
LARAGWCAGSNYPFLTQKERDNETGLDYFLARYYSSTQGRFTSPDEFTGGPDEVYYFVDSASDNPTFYADLRKPQSLNKYQYAYNNPLRWIDPDGHDPEEPEPQNPVAVPVPVGPGGLPLPIPLSPTTPGPSDQQIKAGFDSLLDHIIPKAIDDILYVISQKIGTAPPPVVPPMPLAQPLAPPVAIPDHGPKTQSTGKNKDHTKETERPGRKQPPNYTPFRRPPKKPDTPPPPPKPPRVVSPEIGPDGNPVPPRDPPRPPG